MINLVFWRAAEVNPPAAQVKIQPQEIMLASVKTGRMVTVKGFGRLTTAQKQHLQAYGLLPGRAVQVLAQHPVTIVLIEQTELAIEREIARQVFVE